MTDDLEAPEPARRHLHLLPDRLAICRLPPDHPIPTWFRPGALASATYTAHELSLVVPDDDVPDGVTCERGWCALEVVGPLDFALTGILASIAAPLADAHISIFALSTYDTDYVLVSADDVATAIAALRARFNCTAPPGLLADDPER